MENVLLKYFEERFRKEEARRNQLYTPRPVLTISREYGCPARDVCTMLLEAMRAGSASKGLAWRLISKEILQEAAAELHLHPSKIQSVMDARERSAFDEIVDALGTRKYKSDRAIRSTVSQVVREMASGGNLIILGMGAASILHGYPNVLNVKLVGPLEWRLGNIRRWKGLTPAAALAELKEMDEAREKVLGSFLPPKVAAPQFDLIINCLNIGSEEIVEMLSGLLSMRD